jgi:hypothetical protein
MQKDDLKDLFDELKDEFNVNEPNKGHEQRFLNKLKANEVASVNSEKSLRINWKPYLAIAASLLICFTVFTTIQSKTEVKDLSSVSPELSETQDFFTAAIEQELKKLNNERSPLTEKIIKDALKHIQILETNYQNLKKDLTESGNDQRVIYAMILNFQSRIDILNTVLEQIEDIKQLKTKNDELSNTI